MLKYLCDKNCFNTVWCFLLMCYYIFTSFRQVSWVRHRDIHLLTVGRYTYTSDQRFEALHSPHTEEWTLRIRYAQRKDSGIYEVNCNRLGRLAIYFILIVFDFRSLIYLQCQISTTPPIGKFVYLSIVGMYLSMLFLGIET